MTHSYRHTLTLVLLTATLGIGCGSSERRGTPTGNADVNLPDAGDESDIGVEPDTDVDTDAGDEPDADIAPPGPSINELFAEFSARLQFEDSGQAEYNCTCRAEDWRFDSTEECLEAQTVLPDDLIDTIESCFLEELESFAGPTDDLVAPLRILLLTNLNTLDDFALCNEAASQQATTCTEANNQSFDACENDQITAFEDAEADLSEEGITWISDAANMLHFSGCSDLIP